MEMNYCPNCLCRLENAAAACPRCGYDAAAAPKVPGALGQVILNGRYLLGRAVKKTGLDITYPALDLAADRPVVIQEYFPVGQAARKEGECVSWQNSQLPDGMPEPLLQRARESAPMAAILETFAENNTLYLVREPNPPKPAPAAAAPKKESELPAFFIALGVTLVLLLGGWLLYRWAGSQILEFAGRLPGNIVY